MDWKKYILLIPPFLIIGVLLIFYLPIGQKHYAIFVALLFWIFYYSWVLIANKKKRDE